VARREALGVIRGAAAPRSCQEPREMRAVAPQRNISVALRKRHEGGRPRDHAKERWRYSVQRCGGRGAAARGRRGSRQQLMLLLRVVFLAVCDV